jgi:hypothetical protein
MIGGLVLFAVDDHVVILWDCNKKSTFMVLSLVKHAAHPTIYYIYYY